MIDDEALWEEAREWAEIHAIEEGDVDLDYDYAIIEAWQEEYYNYLKTLDKNT